MSMNIRTQYFLCLSVTVGLLFSCKQATKSSEETTIVKTPVTIVPVTYKSFSSTVALPAVATFMNKSTIRATTAGNIEQVLIIQGDYVNSGQLLFTIKTREAMALDKKFQADTSLNFAGIIKIAAPVEGVISSISHQKGDFVQEGDEMALVWEQNSLVFILTVHLSMINILTKTKTARSTFRITLRLAAQLHINFRRWTCNPRQ